MEEVKQKSVSEIIRETAYNQSEFLTQIAIHIDKLEQEVVRLTQRIADIELKEVSNG
jgi:hypothetical protein